MTTSARGALRVYLGAAPGVGKTMAMLDEGNRRRERGADVVAAYVETHGRERTARAIEVLEVVPRRVLEYRGARFEEMDVDAVLARRPQVALVDELAHTNFAGSRHAKRWKDVQLLLDAGIDVITTVNVQHLESLNDLVEKITGVPQRETVPDAVVRAAEQVQLVDQTPEALRRRMAHGHIYAPDQVDAALSNYFRVGNLTALRELALLWVADRVDEGMQRYRAAHGISDTWETRERVVVALTGGPEGATLIRRAARIAARGGAELLAVHVARGDGLTGADAGLLAAQRALAESLGASYHVVRGDDVPAALLDFARGVNATQLVLGASRRGSLLAWLTGPGVGSRTVRASGDIDVHIVTHEAAGTGRTRVGSTLTHGPRRRILSAAFAAGLLSVLCLALTALRRDLNPLSDALVFLLATVLVALIGGRVVAALTAVAASLLLNYFFTPPLHGFTIAERNNAIGLAVFVVVAIIVAVLVDRAERRRREAARASAESETLATVAGSVLRGRSQLPALLDQVREIFGADSVALLERRDRDWTVVAAAGNDPATRPEAADDLASVDEDTALAVRGPILDADARRTLTALAHQAAAALRTERLAVAADAGSALQAVDATRTALLRAVSHDLRTPLASAKAAVSSLRTSEDPSSAERVEWSTEDRRELLATADESLDALAELIGDLLDMSRLQAGVMAVSRQKVGVDAVIARALDDLGPAADGVAVTAAEDLPDVDADPGLLARIVANLVDNALRFSPPGSAPQVTASALGDRVEVRVVDRGPGLPPGAQERIFAPFQRLGDTSNTSGVGLGLALARGFAEGMGASVMPEETPGGGLTMVVSLPVAAMSPARPDPMTVRA